MIVLDPLGTMQRLTSLYADGRDDPAFDAVVERFEVADDDRLAQLIDADGRLRLQLGKPVDLERYETSVPDLTERPVPLDAAIDMALRGIALTGHADDAAVAALVSRHPGLERAIRNAAELNNALWSTQRVRAHLTHGSIKTVPCDFGPVLASGCRRYQLRELLGAGAFGQVYLAVDRQLSEEDHPAYVAIKVIHVQRDATDLRQRLAAEATKARRVEHPNVARVLDRGVSAHDEEFIVYEFVGGGDLGRWVRGRAGTLSAPEAVRLVAGISRGVHAAHMAGLVHCDIKPNNVVLTDAALPKVADFGIAVRADEQASARGVVPEGERPEGNLAFMSPEQFRMEPGALTIPTDIYAIGGILYWLLTGVMPNGATPEEISRTHDPQRGRRAAPSLREHRPDADRDLDAICRRAMAADPAGRYGSAAALADDLEAWAWREPIAWTKPSSWRRASLWARRKPGLAVASTLLLLTVAGSAFVVQGMAATARERRLEVYRANVRLEEEEKARANAKQRVVEYQSGLREAHRKGIGRQVLTPIWLVEWVYGPTVLGDGPGRFDLWALRRDIVRDLVERQAADGGADHFEALLWESALAFWLIDAGEAGEAIALLDRNHERWRARLDPGDPWLEDLRAMHACAVVRDEERRRAEGGDPAPTPVDLPALATRLAAADQALDSRAPGAPLHLLVLDHRLRLSGPDLLDEPETHDRVARKIARLVK